MTSIRGEFSRLKPPHRRWAQLPSAVFIVLLSLSMWPVFGLLLKILVRLFMWGWNAA